MKNFFQGGKQKLQRFGSQRQPDNASIIRQYEIEEQLRQREEEHQREKAAWERERAELARQDFERREAERQRDEQQRTEVEAQRQIEKQEALRKRDREQQIQMRRKQTTPEALRGLRDLVRLRYQLDTEIWSLRGARGPNRPIVEEKMVKSDAVLQEILSMVASWDEADWSPHEWKFARKVKERLELSNKRRWENNPPWNDRV